MKKMTWFTKLGFFLVLVAAIGGFFFKYDGTIICELKMLRGNMIGLTGIVLFCVGKYLENKQ